MKTIFSIVAILTFCLFGYGQCRLPLEKAPTIGGAFLGMTVDQAISRYGTPFSRKSDRLGFMQMVPTRDPDGTMTVKKAKNFEGLNRLGLTVSGNKVSGVEVFYTSDVKWDSSMEFAAELSKKLDLPNAWKVREDRAYLECDAWTLIADGQINAVFLYDMTPLREKVAADQKAADDKKKAFKP